LSILAKDRISFRATISESPQVIRMHSVMNDSPVQTSIKFQDQYPGNPFAYTQSRRGMLPDIHEMPHNCLDAAGKALRLSVIRASRTRGRGITVKNLRRLNVAASLASFVGVAAVASTGHAQSGLASIYSGGRTANGEIARSSGLTAAHRTLPFGTLVRVTNRRSGRSVVVRINDRGPFIRGRVIDLAPAAARVIGCRGLAPVTVVVVGTAVDHRAVSAPSRPVRANVATLHTAAMPTQGSRKTIGVHERKPGEPDLRRASSIL
jgi:rare lipoprotein A